MKKYFERLGKKSKKAFEKKIDKDTKNRVLTHYALSINCLLYTYPSPRDRSTARMPSSA